MKTTKNTPTTFSLVSDKDELFSRDVWPLTDLGFKEDELPSSVKSINFKPLEDAWLKDLMKTTIWRKRNAVRPATLIAYNRNIKNLRRFSIDSRNDFNFSDIESSLIEAYMHSIRDKSVSTRSAYFSGLNELMVSWGEWGVISKEKSQLPRELKPRRSVESKPRALSPHVQAQLEKLISPPRLDV